MKVLFFANKMPDLCGAFLHDIDLAIELQRRGHQVTFLTIKVPKEGYNGGTYRGFRFVHYSAGTAYLDTSNIWICPHAPILPDVRKLNAKGYNRPIVATCHYDGNYTMLTRESSRNWVEMICFINKTMEPNYRKNVVPWPNGKTEVIRPIMHYEKIKITEPFEGKFITLVNANQNKGVHIFADLAKRMPDRKFLGVLPYYGEKRVPPTPGNVTWIPFDDDIRNILKQTRILIVPSYYESFGRIAVEAMLNGIPVLYSKPNPNSIYPGGSTEGMQEWIGEAAIACERERVEEWEDAIRGLDHPEYYTNLSQRSKDHIESLHLFTEASRIAGLVETFSRDNPVAVRSSTSILPSAKEPVASQKQAPRLKEPERVGRVGFGLSNGRLKIQR